LPSTCAIPRKFSLRLASQAKSAKYLPFLEVFKKASADNESESQKAFLTSSPTSK
jgi:hypothetical protein